MPPLSTRINHKSIYWLGPFITGIFLALGYGVTHRVLILFGGWQEYSTETFRNSKPFPGKSLKRIEIGGLKPEIFPMKQRASEKEINDFSQNSDSFDDSIEQKTIQNYAAPIKLIRESNGISEYPNSQAIKDSQQIFSEKSFDEVLLNLPKF
tara:strand:- start:1412 stop:1867 length:456 start_codon:yes stop_codon:yes gene_type:complete